MKKLKVLLLCSLLAMGLIACGNNTESEPAEETQTVEETTVAEGVTEEATEETISADDLEYISCDADTLVNEMYEDMDAVVEKYSGQYLEITGILEKAEVDDMSSPPGKVVYLKTMVDPPESNSAATIAAYSWDEQWMTQEEFEEIIPTLSEGDEVILRGYAAEYTDYAFKNDGGWRWCQLDLIGISKK